MLCRSLCVLRLGALVMTGELMVVILMVGFCVGFAVGLGMAR